MSLAVPAIRRQDHVHQHASLNEHAWPVTSRMQMHCHETRESSSNRPGCEQHALDYCCLGFLQSRIATVRRGKPHGHARCANMSNVVGKCSNAPESVRPTNDVRHLWGPSQFCTAMDRLCIRAPAANAYTCKRCDKTDPNGLVTYLT